MRIIKRKISACLLLGVLLIALLNVSVPHTSHSHSNDASIVFSYEIDYNSNSEQSPHQHNNPDNETERHTDNVHLHKLPLAVKNDVLKIQLLQFVFTIPPAIYKTVISLTTKRLNIKSSYKEIPYKDPNLLSYSLRGPPFLG